MNFDFSDDQKFLKSEARKFLEANASPAQVRTVGISHVRTRTGRVRRRERGSAS